MNQDFQNPQPDTKQLQQPVMVEVEMEKVEYELIAHTAQRQGLTVHAMLRELAIYELRERIRDGRLPITEDYPPNLKQSAQILAATTPEQTQKILHEPNQPKPE